VFVLAPLGILVNLVMMLFLPLETWLRLAGWLLIGLVIYFGYGFRRTIMAREEWQQQPGNAELPEWHYYRSTAYRRRLGASLVFCAIVAALSLTWLAYTGWLWRHDRLAAALTFEPGAIVGVAAGAGAFFSFMFLVTLMEWSRWRPDAKVAEGTLGVPGGPALPAPAGPAGEGFTAAEGRHGLTPDKPDGGSPPPHH
jgi:hypothetical protein